MDEKTANGDELVSRAIKYLKENKSLDLSLFLLENCEKGSLSVIGMNKVADRLRNIGKYELTKIDTGLGGGTFIISKKSWRERHPVGADIRTGVITAALALVVGWLLNLSPSRQQDRLDTQQDEHLIRLSDSLKILQKNIRDSAAVLRNLKKPVVVNGLPPII